MNRLALVTALALVVSLGCSVSLKERAVRQVQAVDAVLSQTQDTEISLFESGTVSGLTADRHKRFHAALAKAFDGVERTAIALRAWRAGDPVPNDTASILEAANEALAVLGEIAPEAGGLLSVAQRWLETALELQRIFEGGPS
jgi:hypothetical protein